MSNTPKQKVEEIIKDVACYDFMDLKPKEINFIVKRATDKIMALLNHVEKEKYPNYKSSCCGVGVSAEEMGEAFYYKCNKCGKDCDFIPSPNEAPKEKRVKFNNCSVCNPLGLVDYCSCPERQADGSWKSPQPPPPDKEWDVDEFLIYITNEKNWKNGKPVWKGIMFPTLLNAISYFIRSLLLSKDQEADRRVSETYNEILRIMPKPSKGKFTEDSLNEAYEHGQYVYDFELRKVIREKIKKLSSK